MEPIIIDSQPDFVKSYHQLLLENLRPVMVVDKHFIPEFPKHCQK